MATQTTIEAVVLGYMECALWSSTDDEGEPLDGSYELYDFADEANTSIHETVEDFLDLIGDEVWNWDQFWTPERLGHDLWLTRNGHGAGFWDRYYEGSRQTSQRLGAAIGRQLTELCKSYGTSDVYVGDDGKLYVS
jgi:hypothetical protein